MVPKIRVDHNAFNLTIIKNILYTLTHNIAVGKYFAYIHYNKISMDFLKCLQRAGYIGLVHKIPSEKQLNAFSSLYVEINFRRGWPVLKGFDCNKNHIVPVTHSDIIKLKNNTQNRGITSIFFCKKRGFLYEEEVFKTPIIVTFVCRLY